MNTSIKKHKDKTKQEIDPNEYWKIINTGIIIKM